MTPIISCGAEEPLSSNSQLYAVDEAGTSIELATFDLPSLNRYSFVSLEYSNNVDATFALPLNRILAALRIQAYWLLGWRLSDNAVRLRTLISKLRRSQWEIVDRDQFGVAMKVVPMSDDHPIQPTELDPRISGWAIILGGGLEPRAILGDPTIGTLRMFAHDHKLRPSETFLRFLASQRMGVAYTANDMAGRIGLVVVVPDSVHMTVRRLLSEGKIASVVSGPAASSVWTHSM